MPFNPKSLANLRPCKKGETHNTLGRPPRFRSIMKKVPKNMQGKILDVMWTAISMNNIREASAFLKEKESELPECGAMLQVLVRGMMGKNGSAVLMDIVSYLIGKPKQVQEFTGDLNLTDKPHIEFGDEASSIADDEDAEE